MFNNYWENAPTFVEFLYACDKSHQNLSNFKLVECYNTLDVPYEILKNFIWNSC